MRAVKDGLPAPSGEGEETEDPRWTRAVEDQSAPIPEEVTSELGGSVRGQARRTPMLVRRAV